MKIKNIASYHLALLFTIGILSVRPLSAQELPSDYAGTYSDGSKHRLTYTTLILHPDGTFELEAPDPVFTTSGDSFKNAGEWTVKEKKVILNPELSPRELKVSWQQKKQGEQSDSITVRINYLLQEYENEELVKSAPFPFEMLTFYTNKNKAKNRHTLVRGRKMVNCSFGPRWGNQILLDSTNTFRIAKKKVKKVGLLSYGFGKAVELKITDPTANYFEINIVQSIDRERTPRSKEVIVKKKKAYYYELKGKVSTAWFMTALRRKEGS